MRYPIGVQTFEEMINRKYVYVDKTDLVYDLAGRHICFLSRPRRFGKSLLISTLDAYFSGKKELFKGLKIDELEKEWTEYPVFRIDFAVGDYTKESEQVLISVESLIKELTDDINQLKDYSEDTHDITDILNMFWATI